MAKLEKPRFSNGSCLSKWLPLEVAMKGVQGGRLSKRIARSLAAAAQGRKSAQARKKDQTKQREVRCAESSASALLPEQCQQEDLWKQFFADTTRWLDNRQNKRTPRHPDFRHKESKVPLWLNSPQKPDWVDSQLEMMDARLELTPTAGSSTCQVSEEAGGHSEVGMCKKLCEDGVVSDAVDALGILLQGGRHVPKNLFYLVLKRSIQNKDLASGKRIHALTVKGGYEGNAFLATHLIGLYASHGMLNEAMEVFTRVSTPDAYNWAAIIFAYARHGGAVEAAEAIGLYRQLCRLSTVKLDHRVYLAVVKACAVAKDLVAGKEVHARVLAIAGNPDKFVQAGLVNMYVKCGSLEDARRLFDTLPDKDVVTWNAMIGGYSQHEMSQEAINLYKIMQREGVTRPDPFTYASLLQACGNLGSGALEKGKQLHAEIKAQGLEGDLVLGCSLVNMYVKCGSLENASSLFERLSNRDVVTWTTMIAGYTQHGMGQEALGLYRRMQKDALTPPNSVTYVCLLQACASVGAAALSEGKKLQAEVKRQGLHEDIIVGGSLVNMYAKCGSLEDARSLFDKLPKRNLVAWTAMIAGYSQQGMGQEALNLYSDMQQEGLIPDCVTYICLLQACAAVAALPVGERLHAEIKDRGLQGDVNVGTAVVNMYAKCGSISDSQRVFDSLPGRSIEAWGALIGGYARQGDAQVVFDLMDRMMVEGIQPNELIFLCVLTACSHVGLVDKGRAYFRAMKSQYGITPTMEHYICMIDLLGRAGHLKEGFQMAKNMPYPPSDIVWHTLLGACRKWKNVEIGEQAFKRAVSVDEKDAAAYVLMANIYARTRMWEAAQKMQARRTKLGAWKKPGQSWWTDMGGVVHTFFAGDKKHRDSERIYRRLEKLIPQMKKEGYVPHLESSLLNVPDADKEAELCGHSEKLAIAYALNKTAEGTTIRIVKNLRVCEDCHVATAYISKVEKRTIICRDAIRFHEFKEGKCSCGDYW